MKHLLSVLISSLFLVACQIQENDAPSPEDGFIKYYGELKSYEAADIEIIYDETGTIAEGLAIFGTVSTGENNDDYFVLVTDLNGDTIASTSFGLSDTLDLDGDGTAEDWTGDGIKDRFRADETAGQIQHIPGTGFVIVGTSAINISALDVSDWQGVSLAFLDENLQPSLFDGDTLLDFRNISQSGELLNQRGNDVILTSGGELVLAGAKEVDENGTIDVDHLYIRISLNETFIIEEIEGFPGVEDELVRCFESASGGLVFIGSSGKPSSLGENNGFNGSNVYYLETDINGTPKNSFSYGFDRLEDEVVFNEKVSDVVKTPTGFSIVGTISTSQNEEFAYLMNLLDNGTYENGYNIDSSAFGNFRTTGLGVTKTLGNNAVLVGRYNNFEDAFGARGNEGLFLQFDQGGNPIFSTEQYFGLSIGNDEIVDAVTLPDGRIVALGNMDFGAGVKLITLIKLQPDGSIE